MMMMCSFICMLVAYVGIRVSGVQCWCACECVKFSVSFLLSEWLCFMGTMRKSGKWAEQLPVSQQLKHINAIECLVFCWWCYCRCCRCWCCCWARLSFILWVAAIIPRTPIHIVSAWEDIYKLVAKRIGKNHFYDDKDEIVSDVLVSQNWILHTERWTHKTFYSATSGGMLKTPKYFNEFP